MDNYRRITSDRLQDCLRNGEAVLILDLRPVSEFLAEYIKSSRNIPLENLKPEEFLKEDLKGPVYLVCNSGKLAYQAADMFMNAGFSDVVIVAGGLLSWRMLGFPFAGTKHIKPRPDA